MLWFIACIYWTPLRRLLFALLYLFCFLRGCVYCFGAVGMSLDEGFGPVRRTTRSTTQPQRKLENDKLRAALNKAELMVDTLLEEVKDLQDKVKRMERSEDQAWKEVEMTQKELDEAKARVREENAWRVKNRENYYEEMHVSQRLRCELAATKDKYEALQRMYDSALRTNNAPTTPDAYAPIDPPTEEDDGPSTQPYPEDSPPLPAV